MCSWSSKACQRSREIVYYLDGAGSGGLLVNWGWSVKRGLEKAGFRGDFESHGWHTGLHSLAEQTLSERTPAVESIRVSGGRARR